MRRILLTGLLLFVLVSPARSFSLASKAFEANGAIPREYTCQGIDVSPELSWSGTPAGTKSFVLIVEDPDVPDPAAPTRTWVHWVLYDISGAATGLQRDVATEALPDGTRQGGNDGKRAGWAGPCPPIGRHRYVFKLYALSTTLADLGIAPARALEKAMEGHVVGEAKLIGTYEKTK